VRLAGLIAMSHVLIYQYFHTGRLGLQSVVLIVLSSLVASEAFAFPLLCQLGQVIFNSGSHSR